MSRVWRHNLLLAASAAGLAVWLWLDQAAPPPPSPPPLLPLDPADIQRIEIGGAGEALAIVLERDGDRWWLRRPVQVPANAFAIGRLLELPGQPVARRYPPAALDLTEIRLEPPLWTLRYNEHRLAIGGTESLSGRRYVRVGDEIALVDGIDPALLDPNYADLVSRRLFDSTVSSITRPGAHAPDTDAALIENWQNAQALWVIRPDARDYKAAEDRIVVTLEHETIEFRLRQREPQLELIRPDLDLLYVLPGSATGELLP